MTTTTAPHPRRRWQLVRSLAPHPLAIWLVPVLSVTGALLAGGVFLAFTGYNPLMVYALMFEGAFGSAYGISETIVKMTPLLLTSLGVSVAFRMKLWNIGAEGQFYMGAFAATGVALQWPDQPAAVLLPAMVLAGLTGGALWGLLPGILRAYLEVSETITTLMLNYVAIAWVSYLVYGPWRDPAGYNFPLTEVFSPGATLPSLGSGRIHYGLVFGLAAALLLDLTYRYTRWGYTIKVIGESPSAARYAGFNLTRNILLAMGLSGALAGLAGMAEVAGLARRLQPGLSSGYGYTAIIIAWLARLNPWTMVVTSLLFGGLQVGGYSIQTRGLPRATVVMLQGLVLFFVLAGEVLTYYRLRRLGDKEVARTDG